MTSTKIGVLMLDTSFDRPKGDIGNQETFSYQVIYQTVKGAKIDRVVKEKDPTLLDPFVQAAKKLEAKGVQAISTSCGFLATFQQDIQRQLTIPFFSSSLLQIPLAAIMCGEPVGIITASQANLTKAHFSGVKANSIEKVVVGMDDKPAFTGAIIDENIPLDEQAVTGEMREKVIELLTKYPEVKSILLECTNMPPYKNAIREITPLPIFDITTLMDYMYHSVKK